MNVHYFNEMCKNKSIDLRLSRENKNRNIINKLISRVVYLFISRAISALGVGSIDY